MEYQVSTSTPQSGDPIQIHWTCQVSLYLHRKCTGVNMARSLALPCPVVHNRSVHLRNYTRGPGSPSQAHEAVSFLSSFSSCSLPTAMNVRTAPQEHRGCHASCLFPYPDSLARRYWARSQLSYLTSCHSPLPPLD